MDILDNVDMVILNICHYVIGIIDNADIINLYICHTKPVKIVLSYIVYRSNNILKMRVKSWMSLDQKCVFTAPRKHVIVIHATQLEA